MAGDTSQVAVLGLGRFGTAVAHELMRLGHDVLVVDSDEHLIQDIAPHVTHAVQADMTNPDALTQLGLDQFDTIIIGVSEQLEVSILATALLKRMGVPRVIAKAAGDLHGSILEQVGAAKVVFPEREAGVRVARSLAARGVRDYLDIAPGHGFALAPVAPQFVGRTLGEINLPASCDVTVMAIVRRGQVTLLPPATTRLELGDELVVAGRDEGLARLPGTE